MTETYSLHNIMVYEKRCCNPYIFIQFAFEIWNMQGLDVINEWIRVINLFWPHFLVETPLNFIVQFPLWSKQ